jgi:hypothetical protein
MHYKNILSLMICLCCATIIVGQTPNLTKKHEKKNRFYFYWGYNRGYFTKSDLHLTGENYDFTLHHLAAKDRQTPFSAKVYFNPSKLTIPQCNYGIGFFINKHYSVSLAVDHMKYVMVQDQSSTISGTITGTDTPYNGSFDHAPINVKDDLLIFEHTDGLNYIVAELNRSDNLLPLFSKYNGNKIAVHLTEGVGIGGLFPRTNATLLSKERHDDYHLSGYGLSLKIGLDVTLFRHFFIAANLKAGFIRMPDIRTTASGSDRGSQKFGFLQDNVVVGFRF